MLYRAYPPERRAKMARTLILPVLIGPGLAPIIGGAVTQWLSWRWVFFINVPVGIFMVLFAWLFVAEHRPFTGGRLDLQGLVLSGVGLSALLYAISEGSVEGWASPEVLATGLGGIALLWLFVHQALRRPDPILRLRLQVLGQSPLGSGTTTFLEAVGVAVGSQTFGRLYPRFGPRVLAGVGGICLTTYLVLFLLVDAGTSLWLVRALMFFGGFGDCGILLSIQSSMFTHISSADTGHASAIYNTQRQSTFAISIALLTTIVSAAGATTTAAFHDAYLAAAILAALGTLLAWTLIDTRLASSTMSGGRGEPNGLDQAG